MDISIRTIVTDKHGANYHALIEGTHVPSLEGRGEFEFLVWSKGRELFDTLTSEEINRVEDLLFEELGQLQEVRS